ncbi:MULTISPECIES: type IV toxin-antitoxin system AbiEi family antitoxin domain-containing protein [Lactobacillus]|uniref:Transcriptional regulator n=1 Tax=Lactobacillus xujianguonis TaxID=2495899 RepID=A0A437STK3_9LACO|nr:MULTISPECIES: type IV toxin-antitoxin system AbiEi family antitoxin domain-containing protein [Lactobacillus]RVU70238.1 transcriptional regulator [Lactobacillus xujianguonis]RVU73271.1 transcriptional regulator [Lactobacillus xujianguonis]
MNNDTALKAFKNSTITWKELTDHLSNYQIKKMVKNNELERAEYGIYTKNNYLPDPFSIYQLKYERGIFCLNTALYLWNYSDRYPEKLDMMFPQGYNTSKISSKISAHTQISKYFNLGITTTKTIDGNTVKLYSLERTLAEALRPKNYVDPELISTAFKKWAKKTDRDIGNLLMFAQKFKTINQVQNYLEVLI